MSHRYEFWKEGVSSWYAQDYWAAMTSWQQGLDDLVEPLVLPWEKDNPPAALENVQATTTQNRQSDPWVSTFAPLYLFLAGCYLDAQEFDLAEKCCRQGLHAILQFRTSTTTAAAAEEKDVTIRLVQELWSCWEENPAVTTHCQNSRLLLDWLLQQKEPNGHGVASSLIDGYWVDAWQRPPFMFRNLPSQAVCPRKDHPPWCRVLEDHAAMIRRECQGLWQHWERLPRVGDGHHRQGAGAHDGSVVNETGDWREVVLFGSGHDATTGAAQTRQLLQTHCPDAVSLANEGGGEVILSILAPHTRIAPHCASTNLRWTAHLGLQIPDNNKSNDDDDDDSKSGRVQIRVADTWHTWQEGRVLVFDDSYEHEVVNDTDEIRVVLLLRFWNPHLTAAQRQSALPQALAWKAQEQERRYHPPTPPS